MVPNSKLQEPIFMMRVYIKSPEPLTSLLKLKFKIIKEGLDRIKLGEKDTYFSYEIARIFKKIIQTNLKNRQWSFTKHTIYLELVKKLHPRVRPQDHRDYLDLASEFFTSTNNIFTVRSKETLPPSARAVLFDDCELYLKKILELEAK